MIEKILLWDADLDDRAIEIFKVLLLQEIDDSQKGDDPEVFFSGMSFEPDSEAAMEFALVNESGAMDLSVPAETFRNFENEFCDGLPAKESERGSHSWPNTWLLCRRVFRRFRGMPVFGWRWHRAWRFIELLTSR